MTASSNAITSQRHDLCNRSHMITNTADSYHNGSKLPCFGNHGSTQKMCGVQAKIRDKNNPAKTATETMWPSRLQQQELKQGRKISDVVLEAKP